MRQSRHVGRTLREVPKDAQPPAHALMVRAGYIRQSSAGVYVYLPLLWRTLNKISQIIRDEIRPRFGLMRAREFVMKDAYSFDVDEVGLDVAYEAMRLAYHRICRRLGFRYRAVEADDRTGGTMGERSLSPRPAHQQVGCSRSAYACVGYLDAGKILVFQLDLFMTSILLDRLTNRGHHWVVRCKHNDS